MAPTRVRVAVKVCRLRPPFSFTVHGPDGHLGLARHASVHPLAPLPRSASAPLVILMSTVHRPCQRAAETGGDLVFTVRAGERTDRVPSRTAATRYWYEVSGARPVLWKLVTVPGTEPTTLPLYRIRYLSGGGPVAGPDQ